MEKHDKTTFKESKINVIILDFIVSVFQPLVPVVAGAGMLKSVLLLLNMIGVLDKSHNMYVIFSTIADVGFYFLPIFIASTTAEKLKCNKLMSIAVVGVLILPDMNNLMVDGISIFGLEVANINYSSQVFPALLCVLFLSRVEKIATKIAPKSISIFFVPLATIAIVAPMTLLVLGPVGYSIGLGFTNCILFLHDKLGWLAIAILAPILPFIISAGLHKALVPYAVSAIMTMGFEVLYLPALLAHNFAEAGACFAAALRSKDEQSNSIAISAGISSLFGITEPAIFGLAFKNKKVMMGVMSGSVIGAIFIGIVGIRGYAVVLPGLASISMFISEDLPRNILYAIIGAFISFGSSFIITLALLKQEKSNLEIESEKLIESIA